MLSRFLKLSGVVAVIAVGLAGCAGNNGLSNITTASVPPKPKPTVDPVCVQLAGQLDGMRKAGIIAKVEKATKRKRRLGSSDVKKVNAYMIASEQYQARCGKVPVLVAQPKPVTVSGLQPVTANGQPATAAAKPPATTVKKP